jgi:site-specific recombinase XerD
VVKSYGRWLGWLACQNLLHDPVAPGARITPQQIRAYIEAVRVTCSTGTVINLLEDLYSAARTLAPDGEWSWIRGVVARVRARHVPVDRHRDRIVSPAELVNLGLDLMQRAKDERTAVKRAVVYRDGLMIAVLGTRPLRLKNLLGLELQRSLRRRDTTWWVELSATETKSRTALEMPFPDALTPKMDAYVSEHRPVLAGRQGRWTRPVGNRLWISKDGSPMNDRAAYQQIVRHTGEAFGHPVNPHLFRTCAATAIAIEDPAHFGIAARVLGHSQLGTTEKYYDKARATEAVRRHQELIVGIRDGTIDLTRDDEAQA